MSSVPFAVRFVAFARAGVVSTIRVPTYLLSAAALLLAGCQTTPLDRATVFYDRVSFPAKLEADLGIPREAVLGHGRCSLQVTTPGSNRAPNRFCVYARERNALHVLRWNATETRYERDMRYDFAALKAVGLTRFLRTTQVQIAEEMRLSGFHAVIDDGGYYDTAASTEVFDAMLDFGVPRFEPEGMVQVPASGYPVVVPIVLSR